MFEKSYISRISSVDGQALFLGETPDVRPIEYLRSAARRQNIDLPQKMPAQVAAQFEDSQEMTALRSKLADHSSENSIERKKIGDMQQRMRKQALSDYQNQWLQDYYDRSVSAARTDYENLSSVKLGFGELRPFLPERARIADLIGLLVPCFDERRRGALNDLIAICGQRDQRVLFRVDESPVEGRCPSLDCGLELSK